MAPEILRPDVIHQAGSKADVFSYALILYELIERVPPVLISPLLPQDGKRRTAVQLYHALDGGCRPELKKATEPQKEWLARLWATEAGERPTFLEVCRTMEQGENWFDGTDATEFQRFKQWVDEKQAELEQAWNKTSSEDPVPWMKLLVEAKGEITSEVASAIVQSANDGDVEAMKLAAALFMSGQFVKKSVLKGLQYALASKDVLIGTLVVFGERADPYDRAQSYEAQGDLERAVRFYEMSAERGNASAMWRWGSLLIRNDEGMHFEEGVNLLIAAGRLGVSEAYFELGQLYLEGDFIPFDSEKAVTYLKQASEMQHADADIALAVYHHERLEFKEAAAYYRSAAEHGNADMGRVAETLRQQYGV
jgi:TPR repeat protein